jgi:hypothetical protein
MMKKCTTLQTTRRHNEGRALPKATGPASSRSPTTGALKRTARAYAPPEPRPRGRQVGAGGSRRPGTHPQRGPQPSERFSVPGAALNTPDLVRRYGRATTHTLRDTCASWLVQRRREPVQGASAAWPLRHPHDAEVRQARPAARRRRDRYSYDSCAVAEATQAGDVLGVEAIPRLDG